MVRLILLRLLESYFRRPFLNLLPIFLLLGLGAAFVTVQDPEYLSGGKINVNDTILSELSALGTESSFWTTPAESARDEIGELMTTDSFVRAIVLQTDLEAELSDPETDVNEFLADVREMVWAATIGDNTVGLVARHSNPLIAKQLADAAIESFLQWNINTELTDSLAAQEFYAEQTDSYRRELDDATAARSVYLEANPEPVRGQRPEIEQVEIGRLSELVNQANTRFAEARGKEETARLAAAQAERQVLQKYQVLDSPQVPKKASTGTTDMLITVILFGIGGVVLVLIGIIGRAVLDRSFRYPIDVRQGLDLPVLGAIPVAQQFVSPHSLSIERELAGAPEPPRYRARLVPNIDPPTLVVLPEERAEIEQILQERSQHEQQFATGRQERIVPNGFADRDLGPHTSANGVPAPLPRARGHRQATSRPVDLADRGRVRDFWDGHSANEGNRPRTRKKK